MIFVIMTNGKTTKAVNKKLNPAIKRLKKQGYEMIGRGRQEDFQKFGVDDVVRGDGRSSRETK